MRKLLDIAGMVAGIMLISWMTTEYFLAVWR